MCQVRTAVAVNEDWEVGKWSVGASGSLHTRGEKIKGDKGKINVTKVIVQERDIFDDFVHG